MSDNLWTSPRGPGLWGVKFERQNNDIAQFTTQAKAWEFNKALGRLLGGESLLQGKKGQIRERNTYGNDPFPPYG